MNRRLNNFYRGHEMSVNKVILVGRLGKDPETRYMTNGEKQEKTEWHNLVFYRRLAEIAGEYLKKGSQIFVEGKLQTRKWQDKEGKDRYTTEIVVNEMQMLGSKSGGAGTFEVVEKSSASSGASSSTPKSAPAAKGNLDNFDDDIPF